MGKFSRMNNNFGNSNPDNSPKSREEITREIVDYSFQKDIYQGHRTEGAYLIAYITEYARRFQYLKKGEMVDKKPKNENAYIGIAVHNASDLHFIKKLTVNVTVIDKNGNVIGKKQHLLHQRPGLLHYGMNWTLPGDGLYTLRVRIDTAELKSEGTTEDNLPQGFVEVEFPHVMIQTGKKNGLNGTIRVHKC